MPKKGNKLNLKEDKKDERNKHTHTYKNKITKWLLELQWHLGYRNILRNMKYLHLKVEILNIR